MELDSEAAPITEASTKIIWKSNCCAGLRASSAARTHKGGPSKFRRKLINGGLCYISINTNVANADIRKSYCRKMSVINRTAVKSIVAIRVVVN
jgi:hypothetical protein